MSDSSPEAVSRSLRTRTNAALFFVEIAIVDLGKAVRERPDYAADVRVLNAFNDLAALKSQIEKEKF